jgi:hypothetical protein
MGSSVGRDALIRVQGGGRYIDTRTNKPPIWPWRLLSSSSLLPIDRIMPALSRVARRSSTGDHNLLPAADSHGRNTAPFMSISTVFAWTFGSGAVVCGSYHPSPLSNTVWAIVLENMAGCVDAHPLCHWYGSSRLFLDDNDGARQLSPWSPCARR